MDDYVDYVAIGRDVKEENPGQYDSWSDYQVGLAFASEHLPHPKSQGFIRSFFGRKKLENENKRLEAFSKNQHLRHEVVDQLETFTRKVESDEVSHSRNMALMRQEEEIAKKTGPSRVRAAEKESLLREQLIDAASVRGVDVPTLMSMEVKTFEAALEVRKHRAMKRVDLLAQRMENREDLFFMERAKEIEDGKRVGPKQSLSDGSRETTERLDSSPVSGTEPQEDSSVFEE